MSGDDNVVDPAVPVSPANQFGGFDRKQRQLRAAVKADPVLPSTPPDRSQLAPVLLPSAAEIPLAPRRSVVSPAGVESPGRVVSASQQSASEAAAGARMSESGAASSGVTAVSAVSAVSATVDAAAFADLTSAKAPPVALRRRRTLYLPGPVMERLRQECELQRITFAEFVLVTFDRWYGRLDELFPPLAPRTSALPPRKPPRRSRVPNLTPLQLMVTDEELRVLEEVQQQHQVGSLSEMLSGVLEAEFGLRLEYRRALRTN